MPAFQVVSDFEPAGDQPKAIASLSEGIEQGERLQTLLGITGSGKSATIAWTIEKTQRPTLILAPNKSLAAQLAQEMREFFPHNRVEFFVSYYDYYQPEAYIPSSDTFDIQQLQLCLLGETPSLWPVFHAFTAWVTRMNTEVNYWSCMSGLITTNAAFCDVL